MKKCEVKCSKNTSGEYVSKSVERVQRIYNATGENLTTAAMFRIKSQFTLELKQFQRCHNTTQILQFSNIINRANRVCTNSWSRLFAQAVWEAVGVINRKRCDECNTNQCCPLPVRLISQMVTRSTIRQDESIERTRQHSVDCECSADRIVGKTVDETEPDETLIATTNVVLL